MKKLSRKRQICLSIFARYNLQNDKPCDQNKCIKKHCSLRETEFSGFSGKTSFFSFRMEKKSGFAEIDLVDACLDA